MLLAILVLAYEAIRHLNLSLLYLSGAGDASAAYEPPLSDVINCSDAAEAFPAPEDAG